MALGGSKVSDTALSSLEPRRTAFELLGERLLLAGTGGASGASITSRQCHQRLKPHGRSARPTAGESDAQFRPSSVQRAAPRPIGNHQAHIRPGGTSRTSRNLNSASQPQARGPTVAGPASIE